jgi:hypothetical protein
MPVLQAEPKFEVPEALILPLHNVVYEDDAEVVVIRVVVPKLLPCDDPKVPLVIFAIEPEVTEVVVPFQ